MSQTSRRSLARRHSCYHAFVDRPPKLTEHSTKEIEVEVLPPETKQDSHSRPEPGAPIHALSAIILIAIDSLWAIFDFVPAVWIVAIPFCFAGCFIPVYLVQRHLKNDSQLRAMTFACILAILAAIPTPITGTPIGMALLAWTGVGRWMGRRS